VNIILYILTVECFVAVYNNRLSAWSPLTAVIFLCTRNCFLHNFYHAAWNADAVLRFCLSVCPSVRLSNECFVTKQKKDMFRFIHHTKDHLS